MRARDLWDTRTAPAKFPIHETAIGLEHNMVWSKAPTERLERQSPKRYLFKTKESLNEPLGSPPESTSKLLILFCPQDKDALWRIRVGMRHSLH